MCAGTHLCYPVPRVGHQTRWPKLPPAKNHSWNSSQCSISSKRAWVERQPVTQIPCPRRVGDFISLYKLAKTQQTHCMSGTTSACVKGLLLLLCHPLNCSRELGKTQGEENEDKLHCARGSCSTCAITVFYWIHPFFKKNQKLLYCDSWSLNIKFALTKRGGCHFQFLICQFLPLTSAIREKNLKLTENVQPYFNHKHFKPDFISLVLFKFTGGGRWELRSKISGGHQVGEGALELPNLFPHK